MIRIAMFAGSGSTWLAHSLPRVEGPRAIEDERLGKAALFDLLYG